MTIPATGPVSLTDLQTEFGGTNPISLSEYYQDGASGYVTSTNYTPAGQVPTSGPISLSNFRGVSKVVVFTFNDVVSTDTANYDLRARALSAGWDGTTALQATVTINSGVTVYGTPGNDAWTPWTGVLGGAFPNGVSISLINNGVIAGFGGNGGAGGVGQGSTPSGTAGTAGGTALISGGLSIGITNNGTIGGGGGGGGGGGSGYWVAEGGNEDLGGGGGGGGRALGTGGLPGGGVGGPTAGGTAGSNGTLAAPGAGGAPGAVFGEAPATGGAGGAGGNLGEPGQPGQSAIAGSGGAGGAAGAAIVGGSTITWYAFGSRLGTIDHPGTSLVPGGVNAHGDVSLSDVADIGQSAAAWVIFDVDGEETGYKGNNVNIHTSSWYSPTTANVGQSYWIRATLQTGVAPTTISSDVLDTWLPLTTLRSWVYTVANGVKAGTLRIQIAADSAGSSIVFDVLYTFYVEGSFSGGGGGTGEGSGGGGGSSNTNEQN